MLFLRKDIRITQLKALILNRQELTVCSGPVRKNAIMNMIQVILNIHAGHKDMLPAVVKILSILIATGVRYLPAGVFIRQDIILRNS